MKFAAVLIAGAGTIATSTLGYSPSAAVIWADSHCASDDGTECAGEPWCAEFVSNALKAGGHANGCFNETYVWDLDNCLKNNAGWKQTSFPCSKGSVVIWYDNQGQLSHTALSRGDGTIDQHNPSRCGTSGSWGSNYCLTPPSFTEISDAGAGAIATSTLGYSPSAAVSWADSHCASDDGTECAGEPWCAEFVSNALKAGGHANGCFNETYVWDLDNCLKNNAGWKQTSFPCSKGSVVIWYDNQGQLSHTALSRGDGTIDQHNPSRCGTSGSWGSNYCWTPPSFTEISNNTGAPVVV